MTDWVFVLIFVLLGASFGSFLGMCVSRTGKVLSSSKQKFSISLFSGRSFCDNCKNKLKWWENVPIISFLMLKGRCRNCHFPIPFRYWLIELSTTVAFLFTFFYWRDSFVSFDFISVFVLLIFLLISLLLIFIIFFDYQFLIIPDEIIIGLLILVVMLKAIAGFSIVDLYSAIGSFIFLFFLFSLTKGKGMGFGDVKYVFFMGLFLGWPNTLVSFYLAFLTGSFVGVIMILLKKAKIKQKIAFGPFLVFGTFVSWWWGEVIFKTVLKWLNI
jgi:prepilin signal peptidase PulO-like enzyme (type II secretory pathway)